ncbi:thiamine pyrophosphokinase [Aequitasia blattaphilus]|uniref:Thiamine diphosphokinase n=1 Tax=Aequitasia blattaphilus TaxID=2949332 RepID=A0ABT1EAN4_9FIRM|nr:thiamine diphosphokinase [Aequitasia blattaphilus]MCP1102746.1 thiamine diphosphokinase [Aequitasia blattaphilus]MCR8615386.1 thiamine diphosphokinase [Aequitasia blattaphilus]
MSSEFVIVSGGKLEDEIGLKILKKEHIGCVIGVDKGIEFLYKHDIVPSYIVGDFDSASKEIATYYRDEKNVAVKEYNPVKDASDTEMAIRLAMTLGAKSIIILGATGKRLDHLWANVQCLSIPMKKNIKAVILDGYNRISLKDQDFTLKREEAYGNYFSVFSLDGEIHGVTIEGCKYPLNNHRLTPYDSLCVSNEFVEDEVSVSFRNGTMILMETKDK